MVNPRNILTAVVCLIPASAAAQISEPRPVALDVSGGYGAFVDESPVEHVTAGGAVRWRLSPKLSVGPEVVFMKGPGGDRDLFLTGKVVVDFAPRRRVSPYLVADGGLMLHRDAFFPHSAFWSREGAVSFGMGARVRVASRIWLAPEVRLGWEPHLRIGGVLTWNK